MEIWHILKKLPEKHSFNVIVFTADFIVKQEAIAVLIECKQIWY